MAEVSKQVISPKFRDSLVTINAFRKSVGNISSQAVDYAIKNDLVDYVDIGSRVRIIVMTDKTQGYQPNDSPKRDDKNTAAASAKKAPAKKKTVVKREKRFNA